MIDGKPKEYEEYYQKLDTSNPYPDKESFRIGYMYDDKNPCSLMSGLTAANDNDIVLREEIMSETLSYIELSLSYIRKSAENGPGAMLRIMGMSSDVPYPPVTHGSGGLPFPDSPTVPEYKLQYPRNSAVPLR